MIMMILKLREENYYWNNENQTKTKINILLLTTKKTALMLKIIVINEDIFFYPYHLKCVNQSINQSNYLSIYLFHRLYLNSIILRDREKNGTSN